MDEHKRQTVDLFTSDSFASIEIEVPRRGSSALDVMRYPFDDFPIRLSGIEPERLLLRYHGRPIPFPSPLARQHLTTLIEDEQPPRTLKLQFDPGVTRRASERGN